MRKNLCNILIITIILFLIIFLISCEKNHEKTKKDVPSLKIYTSFYALEIFSKWIIPDAELQSLIPSGVDPHHFEPSLKDIQKLYTAKMVIYIGDTDIDRWIDKIKNELTEKGVKVIRLQEYISLKKYSKGNEIDPHVWLDPSAVIEIIKVIKNVAQEVYPDKKETYEKNFLDYESKLKQLDSDYRKTLSTCFKKELIITHEFLNYTGARYGFNSYFIVHEPEEEPSVKKIKNLKDFMKRHSIQYIVSELEGQKIAQSLSEETGAKILQFYTFHNKTNKDYFQVMHDNLETLKKALECSK
jgi:zinc transport system substrate-binding protein